MAERVSKMRGVKVNKAVQAYNEANLKECLAVTEVDVPTPPPGHVLIRVHYSTINPSDLGYLKGEYGKGLEVGGIAGFEGSGEVVASGGGVLGWWAKGKRASFYSLGVWANYAICPAQAVVMLPDNFPLEQAAGAIVNPITVLAMVDIAKNQGHKVILHTAAASALGKMLIKSAKREGINVICVVRREEQAAACRAAGANLVFDSSSPTFLEDLKQACKSNNCTLGFDAVGGDLSPQVLSALADGATLMVYGGLSGKPECAAKMQDLIFKKKKLVGFWVSEYLKEKSFLCLYNWSRTIANQLQTDLSTTFAKEFTLDQINDALLFYVNNMSAGKVLIKCT